MDNDFKIASRELLSVLADRQWHHVYELHEKFGVSPDLALSIVSMFLAMGAIDKNGHQIKLVGALTDSQMSAFNFLSKTSSPKAFSRFIPSPRYGKNFRHLG